ncbi:probable disease resistance protein At1g12280 [Vigna radiata var. radiata]|uniref:Probable disease resistance protein At1g12280 n=1 Tax=Vigna radiata var. radiata TaxID=3916 RepID=A0A3Q0F1K9_VIGRR|nr:probable disease resistance protein At1g12280 [Vigna radiata var. radiata]
MDILNGFLSDVLKEVVCGAVNQLQYSFCFNSFVKELEKEKENLIETKISVKDRVIHAQRQTLKTAEVIDKWLENANTSSESVNRLLRETNTKKSCFFEFCPNWIWRYRLGKKLAIKKADLQKIIQEGRQYIQLERIASIPSNTFDILTEKSINFDSRKNAFDQLVKALKDDGIAMIGLYGMGGCGKTTLAMEVKKIAEAEHLFDKVVFVPVSSTVEVPRIQEKLASSLQYQFPENQEMERAQRLCMRLTQENKILMILDDVWEKLDFGSIGIPSSEYRKGCKILITTRLEEVCNSMDCQKNIYLPILTDEESWTLFQNKALISKDTPENIKHLAKSISNECKGLPVAIVAVASSLKGKKEVIWHSALNKLRSSKPINISRGLQDPYMCLKLSFDNLDTEEAKSLFLLCSVFPEDYEISVECLIRCAIGLGVTGEVHSYEEARTEVIAAKIKLVSSCLMLEVNDECVKMHDLVRDVAHWIAKNENKMIKCEVEKDVSLEEGPIRYLWCVKFPDSMDCSNLEFLSIQTNLEVSDGIFERMGKLRVLIITNKSIPTQLLTMSFKSLINVRCLVLQYWKLRDISFVRDMKKLQSLSFHNCSWPSFLDLQTDVAVTTLTNLKLLEFISCDIESNIFEEIKRIPFLEEFYIYKDNNYWNDPKEESVKFSNSFSVSQMLQRYGIVLGYSSFRNSYRFQEFCSCERTLVMNYFDISNEVIKGLAKKAKELSVGNIEGGAKNMMPDIFKIEEGMNELKELKMHNCEEIECLIDNSSNLSKMGNIFSKLRYMEIFNINHLKTLWHGCPRVNGCFEKMEELYIRDCPQLISLFTYVIAPTNDKTKKSEDQFTHGHLMPSKIFQNLQKMELFNCGELRHVFSASITGSLTQLKILTIEECNMLEQIFEDALPPTHHEETNEIVEEDVQSSSGTFSILHIS